MESTKKILILNQDDKKIKLIQRKDMFCVSLDTILLSNFIKIKPSTKTIIDFGTNNAVIPIILSAKFQGKVIGIEIQEPAVELALENIKLNDLEKRIVIVHEDIKIYAQREKEKVDLIVCNPPFFLYGIKAK